MMSSVAIKQNRNPNEDFSIGVLFHFFSQQTKKKKQKKNKAYEQTKRDNVFTQDISGYDAVFSRAKENYQELGTVTAD